VGVSTDAILFYGFHLFDPERDISICGREQIGEMWIEEWLKKYTEEYAFSKESILENLGVEIVVHCSGDYSIYCLAAKGSVRKAWRGSEEEITDFIVKSEWNESLSRFCEYFGLPQQTPKWLLVSYWGY